MSTMSVAHLESAAVEAVSAIRRLGLAAGDSLDTQFERFREAFLAGEHLAAAIEVHRKVREEEMRQTLGKVTPVSAWYPEPRRWWEFWR